MKMWKWGIRQCKSIAVSDRTGLCIPETKWEKLDNKRTVCTAVWIVLYSEWGKEAANELFFLLPSSSALWLEKELKTRPNLRLLLPQGVPFCFRLRMFQLLDYVCFRQVYSYREDQLTRPWEVAWNFLRLKKLHCLSAFRVWCRLCSRCTYYVIFNL